MQPGVDGGIERTDIRIGGPILASERKYIVTAHPNTTDCRSVRSAKNGANLNLLSAPVFVSVYSLSLYM
ncbi:unnamed protein product [Strongylus vulgaris]|uniref:Uncharacterized protein n=1 Tax=Strongylus vulgaris TaxID=40348 RepID=A0A3P7I5X6_STRVU|nr:unnamed protein product [Strongylus vulgaris]